MNDYPIQLRALLAVTAIKDMFEEEVLYHLYLQNCGGYVPPANTVWKKIHHLASDTFSYLVFRPECVLRNALIELDQKRIEIKMNNPLYEKVFLEAVSLIERDENALALWGLTLCEPETEQDIGRSKLLHSYVIRALEYDLSQMHKKLRSCAPLPPPPKKLKREKDSYL